MKLTKRQLEILKVYAGLIKESAQSYYYGKHNRINRVLRLNGLIEVHQNAWKLTQAGWDELQKRHRNFPAEQAWKLVELTRSNEKNAL